MLIVRKALIALAVVVVPLTLLGMGLRISATVGLIVGLIIRPVMLKVVWLVALMGSLFVFDILPNLVVVKGLPESSGMGDDGLDGEVSTVLLVNEGLERLDEARSVVLGVYLAV
jgi:hypothetical protein